MSSTTRKSVLVLGAGFCSGALIKYLAQHFRVIVGSRGLQKAQSQIVGLEHTEARQLDVESPEGLAAIEKVIASEVDAAISMLPYIHHPTVAALAIKHKKHFLTTSYVSDAMNGLAASAAEAGIIIMNECGVDPGTDHMSAMRVMDKVHAEGGKVVSFKSFCGGLPAPQDNNNPLGYKFSWAPRGVLLASKNSALFLENGKEVSIDGSVLFSSYLHDTVGDMGEYECYPNRNSIQYLDVYNLKGECQTIIRGTYRNKGWCDTVFKLASLGYLDATERDLSAFPTYATLTSSLLKSSGEGSLKSRIAKQFELPEGHKVIQSLDWLGLFGEDALPAVKTNLDALCHAMLTRMQYAEGEQDMILMQHTFVAEFEAKKQRQTLKCRLVDYGVKGGDSSMCRTVGLPVGIACRLVLEGKMSHLKGLQRPLTPEWYNPILDELEQHNIKFVDTVESTESY